MSLCLAAGVVLFAACQREELLSVDPEDAPGISTPTLEVLLLPEDLAGWTDTVFSGFSGPSGATFIIAEDGSPNLTGRGLARFQAPIQDSIFVIDTVSAAERFDSLRFVLSLDTARTVLASVGTTLQVRGVGDEWDNRSADWEFAVDSPGVATPWTAGPGGTLGAVLSEVFLEEKPDSVIFDLTAFSDSLLRLWNDTSQANTGLAIVVADSGHLVAGIPRLHYNIIPEADPDTAIEVRCPSAISVFYCFPLKTYIFDQSAVPPAEGVLRIGGADGWRTFTELVIPDSIPVEGYADPVPLRGSTINRAELFLTSREAPPVPFAAEDTFGATAFELVDDFKLLGAKTPIGSEVREALFDVNPTDLAADSVVVINVTSLIQAWASVPRDSTALPVRFDLRARPEGTTFGYWEFGAAGGEPEKAPFLRLIFTPKAVFAFP
ncbi:MAG: hypothetical protein PVJ43_15530 [Gemmatimonadales bacterium]|jgi:hypothetical protein